MEYVDGIRIKDWYHPSKASQLAIVVKQLLFQLHHLHLAGYIFGDLKLENLLIDRKTKQVRLIDFGGVTQVGRSVREYTSYYDRGYWQKGERKADLHMTYLLSPFVFSNWTLHLNGWLPIDES